MSVEFFDKNIDSKMLAFITIATYCVSYLTVDVANELGIKYEEEDVNLGLIKGVRLTPKASELNYITSEPLDIEKCWHLLGFGDGDFITEREFNQLYLDYVNNKDKGMQRTKNNNADNE